MRRIEIGNAERAYDALSLQLGQFLHRIEVGGVLERPPMKLHEVDRRYSKAAQASFDSAAHNFRRHWTWRRTPFGENCRPVRTSRLAGSNAPKEAARDDFGAAIMIGHIETIESGARVVEHRA
jgi:hypothetical protein